MLLERAYQIVCQRERQYNAIIANMYEMALHSEEQDITERLWQEAWDQFDGHLIALLLPIDLPVQILKWTLLSRQWKRQF